MIPEIDQWGKGIHPRDLINALDQAPQGSDWWFDGRDIFHKPLGTNLDQIIIPIPETFFRERDRLEIATVANLIVVSVNFCRHLVKENS